MSRVRLLVYSRSRSDFWEPARVVFTPWAVGITTPTPTKPAHPPVCAEEELDLLYLSFTYLRAKRSYVYLGFMRLCTRLFVCACVLSLIYVCVLLYMYVLYSVPYLCACDMCGVCECVYIYLLIFLFCACVCVRTSSCDLCFCVHVSVLYMCPRV